MKERTAYPRLGRRGVLQGGTAAVALGLLGCSAPEEPASPEPSTQGNPSVTEAGPKKVLLAYFSRAGENYFNGGRTMLKVGNTAVLARMMAGLVDVDLFEIRAADAYPEAYDPTVARNKQEQEDDARPRIAPALPDLAGYGTVLLGSPIWNVQVPMIMRTFVESVDLAGLTALPFVTYAVSGLGGVVDDYREWLPDSTIGDGLAVRGEDVAGAWPDALEWLRTVGLLD